jgi:hypothetical protein
MVVRRPGRQAQGLSAARGGRATARAARSVGRASARHLSHRRSTGDHQSSRDRAFFPARRFAALRGSTPAAAARDSRAARRAFLSSANAGGWRPACRAAPLAANTRIFPGPHHPSSAPGLSGSPSLFFPLCQCGSPFRRSMEPRDEPPVFRIRIHSGPLPRR